MLGFGLQPSPVTKARERWGFPSPSVHPTVRRSPRTGAASQTCTVHGQGATRLGGCTGLMELASRLGRAPSVPSSVGAGGGEPWSKPPLLDAAQIPRQGTCSECPVRLNPSSHPVPGRGCPAAQPGLHSHPPPAWLPQLHILHQHPSCLPGTVGSRALSHVPGLEVPTRPCCLWLLQVCTAKPPVLWCHSCDPAGPRVLLQARPDPALGQVPASPGDSALKWEKPVLPLWLPAMRSPCQVRGKNPCADPGPRPPAPEKPRVVSVPLQGARLEELEPPARRQVGVAQGLPAFLGKAAGSCRRKEAGLETGFTGRLGSHFRFSPSREEFLFSEKGRVYRPGALLSCSLAQLPGSPCARQCHLSWHQRVQGDMRCLVCGCI